MMYARASASSAEALHFPVRGTAAETVAVYKPDLGNTLYVLLAIGLVAFVFYMVLGRN